MRNTRNENKNKTQNYQQSCGVLGTHLLADKGAQWDILEGAHTPAHVLCPIKLQPCPAKQGEGRWAFMYLTASKPAHVHSEMSETSKQRKTMQLPSQEILQLCNPRHWRDPVPHTQKAENPDSQSTKYSSPCFPQL